MATKYDERVATLQSDMQSVKADVVNLKTDVVAIKTDLAKLQGSAGTIKWILGIFLPLISIWMGTLSYSVFFQAGAASSKIVAELKSPKSPQQLRATLTTATAEIQTARAAGIKPNEKKLVALTGAISQVVAHNPELPEAWRAATELISYRSETSHPDSRNLSPCNLQDMKPEQKQKTMPNGDITITQAFFLSNCSLRLEDVPAMVIPEADLPFKTVRFVDGKARFPVILSYGEVIYEGGPLAHDAGFIFEDCSFDLRTNGVPDQKGRELLTAALNSNDLYRVTNAPGQS